MHRRKVRLLHKRRWLSYGRHPGIVALVWIANVVIANIVKFRRSLRNLPNQQRNSNWKQFLTEDLRRKLDVKLQIFSSNPSVYATSMGIGGWSFKTLTRSFSGKRLPFAHISTFPVSGSIENPVPSSVIRTGVVITNFPTENFSPSILAIRIVASLSNLLNCNRPVTVAFSALENIATYCGYEFNVSKLFLGFNKY